MENFIKRQKLNFLVIIFFFVVSFISGLNHLLIPYLLNGKSYDIFVFKNVSGVTIDKAGYAAYANRVSYGANLGDICLFENRNLPSPTIFMPIKLLGKISKLIGSLQLTFILSDFLFPALTFLVLYLFFYEFTKKNLISIFCSLSILYLYHLMYFFPPVTPGRIYMMIMNLINYGNGYEPLYFSRLETPQLNFFILLLAIYFLYKSVTSLKIIYVYISGVLSGLLFYIFFFYYTFFFTGLFIFAIYFLFSGKFKELKYISIILLIALLIGIPHLIEMNMFSTQAFNEYTLKCGKVYGRYVDLSKNNIMFILFLSILLKFFWSNKLIFLTVFFFSGIICLNLQLIFGYTVQSFHWQDLLNLWKLIIFGYFLSELFYGKSQYLLNEKHLINKFLSFFKKYSKLLISSLITFIIIFAVYTQIRYSFKSYSSFTLPESYKELFSWLNKNTQQDSVVVTVSLELNRLIGIYTRNRIFIPCSVASPATNKEIIERFCIAHSLYRTDSSYIKSILSGNAEKALFEGGTYDYENLAMYYLFLLSCIDQKRWTISNEWFTEYTNTIMKEYENSRKIHLIKKYKIDYIIFGKLEKKIGNGLRTEFLGDIIYKNKDFIVYKIKSQK